MAKILVVDDDQEMRLMIVSVLIIEGYETLEAENGMKALEIIKQQRPDLVISDIVMDNMNGFMLWEALHEDVSTAKIPIILTTGNAQNAAAWNLDPDIVYLIKPFEHKELISAVKKKLPS
jgi:two-component system, sensor histidine kinase and response regulator